MTFDDLTDNEKLALVGLSRLMVRADNRFSRHEAAILEELAQELGADEFWRLADEVAKLDPPAIQGYAKDVVRRDVQEFIYALLVEIAIPDTIDSNEAKLLEWVSGAWNIEMTDPAGVYRS